MSCSNYLTTKREADLLACVLAPLDPDTESSAADRILCDLIDTGLADADRGPAMQMWWLAHWNPMRDEDIKPLLAAYIGD